MDWQGWTQSILILSMFHPPLADVLSQVGTRAAVHAEVRPGGEVEGDPADQAVQGEPGAPPLPTPPATVSLQRSLGESCQSSTSQEFSVLDKANKQREGT